MKPIITASAPAPNGHYEQAIEHAGFIFVSTQLPIDPTTKRIKSRKVEDQAKQVLDNMKRIVEAGGGSMQTIVRVTVYLSDVSLWPVVNEVYEAFFGDSKPARGVIPTGKLHLGADVAADCIAIVQKANSL